ncbi:hypothetical protein GLYMA_09G109902v4 [Glycine max]|nr:hypothetical protein GLYMA_09G109902v4 [Glycine max]KAH1042489.1 hypothetical protein GYH30_024676 [Glycine max]
MFSILHWWVAIWPTRSLFRMLFYCGSCRSISS